MVNTGQRLFCKASINEMAVPKEPTLIGKFTKVVAFCSVKLPDWKVPSSLLA